MASDYTGLHRALLPPKKAAEGCAKGIGFEVPQTGVPILPLPILRCMTENNCLQLPEPVFSSEKCDYNSTHPHGAME